MDKMTLVPLLTLDQYRQAFRRYRCEEAGDIAPSETILGDGWHEAPADIVFEMILFRHIRSHFPIERTEERISDTEPNYSYCDHGWAPETADKIERQITEAFIWERISWYLPLVRKLVLREEDFETQTKLANHFISSFNRSFGS